MSENWRHPCRGNGREMEGKSPVVGGESPATFVGSVPEAMGH